MTVRAVGAWSSPTTFSVPLPPPRPRPHPPPPSVSGIAGVARAKKKVAAITIAFDEALAAVSADSKGFYQVLQGVKKRKKVVYKKPVRIASVSYDGSRDVTVQLAKAGERAAPADGVSGDRGGGWHRRARWPGYSVNID